MAGKLSDDLYALLGIEAGADAERLRQVWRKLARQWHPDHAGPEATAMFQKLSAAYEVLSDPVGRAAYDRRRSAAIPTPSAVSSRRRAPNAMLSRVCGPLNSLLACGIARRGDGGVIDLLLNADEAARGGMVTISMRVRVRKGDAVVDELFSAWLAISPDITPGAIIAPSVMLPGTIDPVRFRIRVQPSMPKQHD